MNEDANKSLLPNAFASWLAYGTTAVIGFVMPRVVLESVGQELLGIWDLCWSFVAFLTFSGIGFGPSVSHYVPRAENTADICRVTASAFYPQLLIAVLAAMIFGALVLGIPTAIGSLALQAELALALGLYIGGTVMLVMIGDIPHGALIGAHLARRTEAINVVHDICLAIAMIAVLLGDQGILGLAAVTFAVRAVFEALRFFIAFRNVPGFALRPGYLDMSSVRSQALYATKTSIYGIQELAVYQSIRVGLFVIAGPLVFAAFSRYATIARQINRFLDRLSLAVPALTSDLAAAGESVRVQDVYSYGLRAVLMISLPALIVFGTFGDELVYLWMGSDSFIVPGLAWGFVFACFLHAQYSMSSKVLAGINAHGRISLACLVISAAAVALVYLVQPPVDGNSAVLSIAIIMFVSVHLPHVIFASWKLAIPIRIQIRDIYYKTLIYNGVFLLVTLHIKQLIGAEHYLTATLFGIAGFIGLMLAYWFSVCDDRMRVQLRHVLPSNRLAQP